MVNRRASKADQTQAMPGAMRLYVMRILAIVACAILVLRVARLQVYRGHEFAEWADRMRFREVTLPAPRGVVYDRNGEILARNIPSFTVSIVPADLPDDEEEERAVIQRLVDLLQLKDHTWVTMPFLPFSTSTAQQERWEAQALAESLRNRSKQQDPVDLILGSIDEVRGLAPYRPLVIETNIGREQAFILEEEHLSLAGVHLDIEPLRQYSSGELTSDILGYVGPIPEASLDAYRERGYRGNDLVGLMGVEYAYEDQLRGSKGSKMVEVDVAGREVRTVGEAIPPAPGNNLALTLDLNLQRVTETALRKGLERANAEAGVAIAMEVKTGSVLSMVTLPTYDNNLFSGGIAWRDYERLSTDKHRPLLNHAISGQYPPGSVFKIVAASASLEEGVLSESTQLRCDGIMYLANQFYPDNPELAQKFYCWIRNYGRGHGLLNVTEALAQSCDIFFYQVAGGYRDFNGLGAERLAQYALQFGFGAKTGIDLPGESAGLIPSGQWKRLNYGEPWVTGDTYNMAIGQGFVLATPLQILNAFVTVADDGNIHRPHVVKQIVDADGNIVEETGAEIVGKLPISDYNLHLVQKGLAGVIDHGTAVRAGLKGITVAGKTGTAEYAGPRDSKGNLPTHAWFVAYAPVEDPEVAVIAFVYSGGEGSEVSVPIVTEILSSYFDVPPLYEDKSSE